MRKVLFPVLMLLFALSSFVAQPAQAQEETPPASLLGAVRGTVINRNTGQLVEESLEVMLHILDQNLLDKGMEHGQSQSHGTFVFPDIPFDENTQFAATAIYDGVTYFSETTSANLITLEVNIEMPILGVLLHWTLPGRNRPGNENTGCNEPTSPGRKLLLACPGASRFGR